MVDQLDLVYLFPWIAKFDLDYYGPWNVRLTPSKSDYLSQMKKSDSSSVRAKSDPSFLVLHPKLREWSKKLIE